MIGKISEVESIWFGSLVPDKMVIGASGNVNTGGWKNGELAAWVYFHPPADGIQDFDFIAEPPTGQVIQVPSIINAQLEIGLTSWIKGFRIHSATNQKEALFDQANIAALNLKNDDLWPWPW